MGGPWRDRRFDPATWRAPLAWVEARGDRVQWLRSPDRDRDWLHRVDTDVGGDPPHSAKEWLVASGALPGCGAARLRSEAWWTLDPAEGMSSSM